MPYVMRDASGKVIAISLEKSLEAAEFVELDSPEVVDFMSQVEKGDLADTLGGLYESDKQLVRVLEDLIDVLIDRDIIHFTDLPEAAQKKLMSRQSMRKSLNPLQLFGGDDEGLI